MEYSNINNEKTEEEKIAELKKNDVIVKSGYEIKKDSIFKKIKESFIGDTSKSLGEYLLFDVAIPASKDLLCDLVEAAFGRSRNRGYSAYPSYYGHSSYTAYFGNNKKQNNTVPYPGYDDNTFSAKKVGNGYENILLNSRADAEEIIRRLRDNIAIYNAASIGDFYDCVGQTCDYIDYNYGWRDLSGAFPRRERNGLFSIVFPKPEYLKNR